MGPLKLIRRREGPSGSSELSEFPPQVEVVATSSVEHNAPAIAIAPSSRIDEESREFLPPLFHGTRRRRRGFIYRLKIANGTQKSRLGNRARSRGSECPQISANFAEEVLGRDRQLKINFAIATTALLDLTAGMYPGIFDLHLSNESLWAAG